MPGRSLIGIAVAALVALSAAPPAGAAETTAGQIFAFGDNDYGQLGSPLNDESEIPNPVPALVALPGASGQVTQVAAGAEFSLALTSTGQLYAFGDNDYGQLGSAGNAGSPEQESNPVPALVTLPGASGPVTQIAAGELHSLVLTSTGQLYAFGSNEFGQLGTEANSGTLAPNPTPALVTLPGAGGQVVQIAAGGAHSLALTATGQLYAFGENDLGQLGNEVNNRSPKPNPTPALVTLPPGAIGGVTQVAAGSEFSLALTASGQLYGFGMNSGGQLGNATNAGIAEPNPTPMLVALPPAAGAVAQIAGGQEHSLALTVGGQLYAFGSNKYGQLGTETNVASYLPNPVPTLVTLPGQVGAITQIAAGRQHSLVVTSGGQLYTFGRNQHGQLGGEVNSNANPTPTPVALPAGSAVESVARGPDAWHTLALVTALTPTQAPSPTSTSPLVVAGHGGVLSSTTTAQPPTLTSARLTNSSFRVSRQATAISARSAPRKASVGTTFRFNLSASATLRIEFDWTAPGLLHGHACLVPTAGLKRSHARRCARSFVAGALVRTDELQGADSVPFSGRIGSRALTPYTYDAVLTASNAAGSSLPLKVPFAVVR